MILSNILEGEFKRKNDFYLRKIHLYINNIYHSILFGDEDIFRENEKYNEFKMTESIWIENEKQQCLNRYNCDKRVITTQVVEEALKDHGVFNHQLFDFLCHEANLNQLKLFISSESILNVEFFDYLVLSIIGVSGQAKLEIISNLWDEAGRGDVKKFHTTLFSNLMNDMGLNYKRDIIIENMSWEGLAGINLFSNLSYYSYNKTKYFGLLAATEMLDPPHYNKLITGMSRIFKKNKMDQTYYVEHESIDVEHASGWLNKVIIPELAKNPGKTREFWLGFYMRLDSAKRYYDKMMHVLTERKAA